MLGFLLVIILLAIVSLIMTLDVTKKISVTGKMVMWIYLIIAPHILLVLYFFSEWAKKIEIGIVAKFLVMVTICVLTLYIWIRLNIFPRLDDKSGKFRLIVMIGGRTIMYCSLYTVIVQLLLLMLFFSYIYNGNIPTNITVIDSIITIFDIWLLLMNGSIRMICTSKRLRILKRVIIICTSLIPIINVVTILYACHIIKLEYDHDCNKVINSNASVESQVCATKYPIIMVHGIGFRDLKYINYWGRIPKTLIKNGARIYYGNQEAFGTVENNANDVKEEIFKILKENNCDKVNIIAHSKGGLDARYMISNLNMATYVASLTMISTPHKGSGLLDVLCKLPDGVYRRICNIIDKHFRRIGDNNPDSYTSSRQLSPAYALEFNQRINDADNVYYQSYTSIMKNCLSHFLLAIPYLIMKPLEGDNDGLVGIESARWGNFRGVITNKYMRGISHGDIIDIRREDYKGFDVLEKHTQIVSELKKMGF